MTASDRDPESDRKFALLGERGYGWKQSMRGTLFVVQIQDASLVWVAKAENIDSSVAWNEAFAAVGIK